MTNTTYQLDDFALTLPITQKAIKTAQEFASQQPTSEKAEQVRLNTLAVWVVNDYMQMMAIPTDLEASDSWNHILRCCTNVADLELPSVGRLECRPLLPNQQICSIPPETWEERVGYVVVKIDESRQEVRLMGFVPHVATEELPLSQLQPLEALIEHLGQLSFVSHVATEKSPLNQQQFSAASIKQPRQMKQLVNLSQWFAGIFDAGWQSIESLLNTPELTPANAFRRLEIVEKNVPQQPDMAKLIDLGLKGYNQPVILKVEICPEANQQTGIFLKLWPTGNQIHLPQGLKLTVLDGSGSVLLAAQARKSDNYLQLKLSGEPKEQFSVMVALNDTSVMEEFII
ncbi:Protein of unknown function (DUF1822) [Cylindrospermum stagnale PCC 7417]|uniref:DUF1822 family protein n=1 Tax=Cylindrospermum stagnale PCC 7417 TaxID=56107 RepID=K9WWP0_9NOST|nr:DUF1822 family protein [Cylindrospermum stagnale]AFZ23942.1 Protein of unknown function (DUF1822) [Cylindrospermum stagnale PCC 7417]